VENRDKQFETYLLEFQPRCPPALPETVIHRRVSLRRLAAAAVVTIALGASLWFVGNRNEWSGGELGEKNAAVPETKSAPPPLSLLPLTQLALRNPEKLEAELARASRRVLPDFRGSESTLRVLAKE
jgi:hypothetical protein